MGFASSDTPATSEIVGGPNREDRQDGSEHVIGFRRTALLAGALPAVQRPGRVLLPTNPRRPPPDSGELPALRLLVGIRASPRAVHERGGRRRLADHYPRRAAVG